MLRDYQIEPVAKCYELLKQYGLCYLNAEVRTGKTTMALTLADRLGCKSVLFVTVKKVLDDKVVERDYIREGFGFELKVTNYESLHKINKKYDIVIADEAHRLSKLPKPALRTKNLKKIVGDAYLILMSGTAHPESMSQLYHQFWLSARSPFPEINFYKWAHEYVDIKEKHLGAIKVKDYSKAKEDKILAVCGHLFVKVSQSEAGFKIVEPADKVIEVPIDSKVYKLVQALIKDRIYTLKNGDTIICDTPASLQGKIHQIFSGTVKGENKSHILDTSKARYIRDHYAGQHIVIFYKYIAEGDALKAEFASEWTDSPTDFNSGLKRVFISQVLSGSLGINLSTADVIIFYNIDYSYVQYEQARARMQSLERTKEAKVHWLFAERGIEHKIYNIVQKKKDYSVYYFKKDFMRVG